MKYTIAFGLAILAFYAPAFAQDSELISVAESGVAASGASELPALSADGRYVAFESTADDLVPGDFNGAKDVFVRDRYSETTELVSVDSFGNAANGPSERAALPGDGGLVAFVSSATNLVANDANQHADVFVHDRASGVTRRVSISSAAAQANGPSTNPALSGDGRFVAFQSTASNLVAADTNGAGDVFVHDLFTGATQRVSVTTGGAQANGPSEWPSLSHDGRYIAFASRAANLTGTGLWQVFRRDRAANVTQAANQGVTYPGTVGDSRFPSITSDGNKVTFQSTSSTLVPNDLNGHQDVFVHTFSEPHTSRISVGPALTEANGPSFLSRISPDGSRVAFKSQATNLVLGDTNGAEDVFLSSSFPSAALLISVGDNAQLGNDHASRPSVSTGGAAVAFQSSASNLTPLDGNGSPDVFMWQRAPITYWVDGAAFSGGNGSAGNPFDEIQDAISSPTVFQGDTINILPGTYVENVDLSGKGLSLIGVQGAAATIIDGGSQGSVIALAAGEGPVFLKGLTLTGGSSFGNVPHGDGGGVYCQGCTLNIQDCTIMDNGGPFVWPQRGGGVYAADAFLLIESTLIANNQLSDGDGGGLYCRDSSLTVQDSEISEHLYAARGGGVYLERTNSQWTNCKVLNNIPGRSQTVGKGIFSKGPAVNLTLDQCEISGNGIGAGLREDGGTGGGVYAESVDLVVRSCSFSKNVAGFQGGGGILLLGNSTSYIEASTFAMNGGHYGGAIKTSEAAALTVLGSSFMSNGAYWSGGALHQDGPSILIDGCLFNGNASAEDYKGGALWGFELQITNSMFVDNRSVEGGAVYGGGSISKCVFLNNYTYVSSCCGSGSGGAVAFGGSISESLFVGNTATGGGNSTDNLRGGAIYGGGTVDRCTIIGNTAGQASVDGGGGGGVWGATVVTNSILRDNYPDDLNGGATATWSIVDEPGTPGLGNLDVDPKFASDYNLMPHSPAVDAGDPAAPLDPDGSRADMGAFPYFHGTAVFYCTAKQTSGGCLPAVGSSGNLSYSGPVDFHITASQVPNLKPGMLVWGSQQGAIPLGGGILCMAPPIARTPIQFSNGSAAGNDCSGVFDYLMTPSYLQGFLLQPGQAIFAQYWFRDPGFAPPNNTGLSNALAVGIAP